MKNILSLILLVFLTLLSGCNSEGEDNELIDLDGVDTIYILNGSTNVNLTNTEDTNLEVNHGNYKLDIKQDKSEILLNVKKSWYQFGPRVNLNKKFKIAIPKDFSGKIILEGGSSNITSDNLQATDLDIKTRSGNVTIEYVNFQSNLEVNTVSGNVDISLNNDSPDINLKVNTVSGNQMVAVPLDKINLQKENRIEGTSGNETDNVHVETTSGNISIK
ncbi:DUF4097 family beta strand repeat-containing protein [Pseudogracilibacillus sp. SE30717A]|uniref:DUF4097 family beta strand repeat-containing protein n=1 Tax=Pseudogracilibacillus sp. SE30717A TaxID=3098293 RepID=UPI00300E36DB